MTSEAGSIACVQCSRWVGGLASAAQVHGTARAPPPLAPSTSLPNLPRAVPSFTRVFSLPVLVLYVRLTTDNLPTAVRATHLDPGHRGAVGAVVALGQLACSSGAAGAGMPGERLNPAGALQERARRTVRPAARPTTLLPLHPPAAFRRAPPQAPQPNSPLGPRKHTWRAPSSRLLMPHRRSTSDRRTPVQVEQEVPARVDRGRVVAVRGSTSATCAARGRADGGQHGPARMVQAGRGARAQGRKQAAGAGAAPLPHAAHLRGPS